MLAHVFADFQANMWLYISIPFISGIIGYVTKVVAIKMMFAPMDFLGFKIGPIPIGWQGIVPRKAEKMATISVDLMTSRLINANEVFARLDPNRIAKEIEVPMTAAAKEMLGSNPLPLAVTKSEGISDFLTSGL